MLSAESSALITRVGPGTPMGELMRQYWLPALLASELAEPGGDPVRVMLLGERLLGFRDSTGRVGLQEHGGERRGHAYPCVEAAGLVWTYLGARATPPPLPALEIFDAAPAQLSTQAYSVQCNWLQAMEGDHDPTHFAFLHSGHAKMEDAPAGSFLQYMLFDPAPRHYVLDIAAGVLEGASRRIPDNDDELAWRIAHFLFPFHTITGVGVLGRKISLLSRVPMDDGHTLTFSVAVDLDTPVDGIGDKRVGIPASEYTSLPLLPNTDDWLGRFRWRQNADNDYLIDRDKQRRNEKYSGIDGVIIEDVAVTESMGPIVDHTREHLGSADLHLIRIRRRLIAAARELAEHGTPPPGVDDPDAYLQRSGAVILPKDADWIEATAELRRARVRHEQLSASYWSAAAPGGTATTTA